MKDKARSLLEAARRELSRRKTKKAVKYLDQAVEADPDSHEVLAERAGLEISPLRDYRGAVDDLNRAIELAPLGSYHDMRGQAYWYLREYERAFEDFNTAINADPTCAPAYYHRGNFFEKLQRYESAIDDMQRAAELDAENQSYKRRLDEIKRAAILHAEKAGTEPPDVAREEEAPVAADPPEEGVIQEPAVEEPVLEEPFAAEAEPEALVEEQAPPAEPEPEPQQLPLEEPTPVAEPPEPAAPAEPETKPAEVTAEAWSVRIPTGETFGPVSIGVLKLWAEQQRVKPEDHVLAPGGKWAPANRIAELAAVFEDLRTTRKPPVRPD